MSRLAHLPFDAPLAEYEAQADALLAGHAARDPHALQILRHCLPTFLDPEIPWKPRHLSDGEILATSLTDADTRLAIARAYSYRDWESLESHVGAMQQPGSPVHDFEHAAEAVITGDLPTLSRMLEGNPALVAYRSTRLTSHDPAMHGATLLHYVGANGLEVYRQRTPLNAVEVATLLLDAGAEVDATAGMYGGRHATLSMLITSSVPRAAGVHLPLVALLLDRGASADGVGESAWSNPLLSSLVFGYLDAAELVAKRGARTDTLPIAAGLGRLDDCTRLLPGATADARHQAFALAAINGQLDIVRLLLDAGEDPDRMNPTGMHAHQTPLHGAALAGNLPLVRLLVERGARTDIRDPHWHATPLGWAQHAGHRDVVQWLETIEQH